MYHEHLFSPNMTPISTDYDIVNARQCPRPSAMSWSCNCEGIRKDNYVTMHATKADGEGKCILCGHYAYQIENHKLHAERTWLHKRNK